MEAQAVIPGSDSQTVQPNALDIELRCPVEPRILSLLRSVSKTLAQEAGFTEEAIDQIEMAVDEACANVVRHAYKHVGVSPDLDPAERRVIPRLPHFADDKAQQSGDSPECVIKMRVSLGDGWVQFQIIDHGIGANQTPEGVNSIEEFIEKGAKGGLGIYIIRSFMDEVTFEFPEGKGTVLTMTKYNKPSESA
ncbi:MAG: serine/threonine-protein kinase RsbW [Candidatus Sumerlaeota bacterium]|nr:serine/threonine-protein kinase RsbW [Candidatus Sumerlaeota bacterium]